MNENRIVEIRCVRRNFHANIVIKFAFARFVLVYFFLTRHHLCYDVVRISYICRMQGRKITSSHEWDKNYRFSSAANILLAARTRDALMKLNHKFFWVNLRATKKRTRKRNGNQNAHKSTNWRRCIVHDCYWIATFAEEETTQRLRLSRWWFSRMQQKYEE